MGEPKNAGEGELLPVKKQRNPGPLAAGTPAGREELLKYA